MKKCRMEAYYPAMNFDISCLAKLNCNRMTGFLFFNLQHQPSSMFDAERFLHLYCAQSIILTAKLLLQIPFFGDILGLIGE